VGEDEADFSQGKISIRSPLARGMIGKQPGDVFYVQTPGGEREYTVEDVFFD
jgi:transcription elongation factor GreA